MAGERTTRRACLAVALAISATFAGETSASPDGGTPASRRQPQSRPQPSRAETASTAEEEASAGSSPHGSSPPHRDRGAHDGADGLFQPPEDGSVEDASLPSGTIEIRIADPAGNPLPNVPVTLGIMINSVAKGESRKRISATTNDDGVARFDHLDVGSTVAYRPMVIVEGATFEVMPFRLPEKAGMRATLHVYPVVNDIESALVVAQSVLYTEVKDDRIQVQQAFRIYNLGRNAWVPKELVVPLPERFTAFSSQQGMTDVGVEAVPNRGVRIHGTFAPGQHALEFRWQLPYSGEPEVRFDVGMPPHMAASRVIAPAAREMSLEVEGFPPASSTSDGQGQRSLVTEKQIRREDPSLKSVTILIKGIPTEGPAKIVATLLSACGLVLGLVLGARKPPQRDRKGERDRLLRELEDLERARQSGDVGPKTYERARRELIDDLARTISDDAPAGQPRGKARAFLE